MADQTHFAFIISQNNRLNFRSEPRHFVKKKQALGSGRTTPESEKMIADHGNDVSTALSKLIFLKK